MHAKRRNLAKARQPGSLQKTRKLSGKKLNSGLKKVRLFLCDVDGVLTDATVLVGSGAEMKAFHIRDGLGLALLQRAGIKVGWISARPSPATARRAAELKVDFLEQSATNKVAAIEKILAQAGLSWSEVCYMGDDLFDLGVLRRAGVAVAVQNAVEEAKMLANYVTSAIGGHGAVREMVELILKAQGHWKRLVSEHAA